MDLINLGVADYHFRPAVRYVYCKKFSSSNMYLHPVSYRHRQNRTVTSDLGNIKIFGYVLCRQYVELFHECIFKLAIDYKDIPVRSCEDFNRLIARYCADNLVQIELMNLRGNFPMAAFIERPLYKIHEITIKLCVFHTQLELFPQCFPNTRKLKLD